MFVVRTRAEFRSQLLLWGLLYISGFHLVSLVWRRRAVDGDRLLLAAAHLVTGIGFVILLSRPDPLRDIPLFVRYSEGVLLGLGLMTALSIVDFGRAAFRELSYLPLLGAIGLCALLILFGSGPSRSGARFPRAAAACRLQHSGDLARRRRRFRDGAPNRVGP